MKLNYWIAIIIGLIVMFGLLSVARAEVIPPDNLWQGLVAEDTMGDYDSYVLIASIVYNRLSKGMGCGIVALKRNNLEDFVKREVRYVKAKYGKDTEALAKEAVRVVFKQGVNTACSATHYEHTRVYGKPYWADSLEVVKVVSEGSIKEITCWK